MSKDEPTFAQKALLSTVFSDESPVLLAIVIKQPKRAAVFGNPLLQRPRPGGYSLRNTDLNI